VSVPPAPFATYGTEPGLPRTERQPLRHQALRDGLDCRFDAVDDVFDDCIDEAQRKLSTRGLDAYLGHARTLGKLGRGVEPLLVFLEIWPGVAESSGETSLAALIAATDRFQKSPNGPAIVPLLQSLGAVARRLRSPELMAQYLELAVQLMQATSISIHGRHATEPSPCLPTFLHHAPELVGMVPLEGLRRWVSEGIRLHGKQPQRQVEFFALATPDSRALLQRERHGTLLVDIERRLTLTLRCLWNEAVALVPYPVDSGHAAEDSLRLEKGARIMMPHLHNEEFRVPEVLDDWPAGHSANTVTGLQRYRAILAHLAAHRRWSRPQVADNLSPLQRLAVEFFEDCRVDCLMLHQFPGLRPTLLALHPAPREDACDERRESGLRHRLVCLSRALLDDQHGYRDPVLLEYRARFHELLRAGASSTRDIVALAVDWSARTRRQSDQQAKMRFADTLVSYRDDNRHLWAYIEAGDEEEAFDERRSSSAGADAVMPPRHYPEWDEAVHAYRPDWASVYDTLQSSGDPADIDALLARHAPVAKHLKRLLDLLKPQDRTRLRYQEEGTELDLDVAVRAISDWRAGAQPDPRIHMSTRSDGRDIAVLLLVDLSASVNDAVPGTDDTVLGVSRAAVALLAWAVSQLGDELAIAGFHSNTRHEVRYLHIKGFAETWDEGPKARLAATAGAYSTRMGAALRHAGHLLSGRDAAKKLLLVLTDGQPADLDVSDPQHLPADAAQAVRELDTQGLHTHCISLDARAGEYVGRIFGNRWTAIDHVDQLPRRLPELFLSLTR
jgi:nitric oxide reductase NorD protein